MAPLNRRTFLQQSALAGLAALPLTGTAPDALVLHQVYFWLKNPKSEQDRRKLVAGLQKLRAIPQVKQLYVGYPASTEKRDVVDNSFDVSELMLFASVEDQNTYQVHPLHQQFVKECSALWSKVVVYDTTTLPQAG